MASIFSKIKSVTSTLNFAGNFICVITHHADTPKSLYGFQVYVGATQNITFVLKSVENWMKGKKHIFFILQLKSNQN